MLVLVSVHGECPAQAGACSTCPTSVPPLLGPVRALPLGIALGLGAALHKDVIIATPAFSIGSGIYSPQTAFATVFVRGTASRVREQLLPHLTDEKTKAPIMALGEGGLNPRTAPQLP